MMEALFLNAVTAISESRYWLMPLLLICALTILTATVARDVKAEMDKG